ncbi:leucyl aminopeptidase family protein [Bacteriovorax sp. Seq25_V]|uniref:M17 family metallopeptidase n=1 Tax=Bacteriovorax sp. Seq25_V TaxID=1201288 RepID=UPI00038A16B3|nr:leucyl aminopeptidase family protein [Bacteriovorax sp. Seq25_V]EQC47584.1 cytosol aminopeptidase family, catalytic domain protein [Bacteriovorax sp. Seq25_V]
MNFKINSGLSKSSKKTESTLLILTSASLASAIKKFGLSKNQLEELKKSKSKLVLKDQTLYTVVLDSQISSNGHDGFIDTSLYGQAREALGQLATELAGKTINIEISGLHEEQIIGSIVGLELGLYRFSGTLSLSYNSILVDGKKIKDTIITSAKEIAVSINQARHLVNLPPNELHPVSYANEIKKLYAKSKSIKVEVLDEKKLAKEKCGLLLSVGRSSNNPPRIVHLKYSPAGAKGKSIALVGKGLTFDSGGLDIKPAAGMRLMKKDMGGSATLIGLSRWLENSKIKKNVDIYLALAENAISENASRPSDIYMSRAGISVEIHNTDAEGRLALADTISYALDKKPEVLIDVATLTGAGKVSLGQDIASLFSNDDGLATALQRSSAKMNDLAWRMPLYQPYIKDFNSDFADMTNAGSSGYAGSITAALFLEKFITKGTKWAHLDIFGWTSGAKPSLVQRGGSGQSVETLIDFLASSK